MKNTSIILSSVAVVLSVVVLALNIFGNGGKSKSVASQSTDSAVPAAGEIVYLQVDSLIANYDMYNDLMSAFQTKAQGIQDDLQKKGRKLESDAKAFENQMNKGLLTRSAAEQQQQKLVQRQQELQNEAATKQAEIQEEEFVLNNQVLEALRQYIEKYNEVHGYKLILSSANVLNVNPSLDITADVLAGMNEEYIQNRNKK